MLKFLKEDLASYYKLTLRCFAVEIINGKQEIQVPFLTRSHSLGEPHSLDKHDYPFSQMDLQMASMM